MTDPRRSHRSSHPQTYEQWAVPTSSYNDHPSYSDEDNHNLYTYNTPPISHTPYVPPPTSSWPGAAGYPPTSLAPPESLDWLSAPSVADASMMYATPTTSSGPSSAHSHPSPPSPLMDASGRYHCTFASCTSAPFTRKSDFRRHMDKHTRPYTCPYPSCADLAGFGWVGGLNRHLEEIHNSAGAQHKCPYEDCKRHVKGFNRVANLKKHLRVHEGGHHTGSGESGGEGRMERDSLVKEIRDMEREVATREREENEARRRRVDASGRLEELRRELQMDEGGYY